MIFGINIMLFMGVVLPPLIYALIIYLTSPHKSINIRTGMYFIVAGIFSVTFFPFLSLLFPEWLPDIFSPFKTHFFYVGPREELLKYLSFFLLYKIIKFENHHPISIMFYMGMVGLGFAMVENIQYLSRYGVEILKMRAFTSTIAHMLFGMFAGYWIALSKIKTGIFSNRSVFGIFMNRHPKVKKLLYLVIGLLCSITYHGLWNYNLETSGKSSTTIMILMLFLGLVVVKFSSLDIISQYKKENKKSTNNRKNII
jgi:RsiW-degrading membrane proteinase PrsW (M82 family)